MVARTAGAEVSFDEGFWPSVQRLDSSDSHRVIQALNLFAKNPEHPNLHLKPLKGRLSQLMSVRAGRDVRVMLVKRGDTYIWLQAEPSGRLRQSRARSVRCEPQPQVYGLR